MQQAATIRINNGTERQCNETMLLLSKARQSQGPNRAAYIPEFKLIYFMQVLRGIWKFFVYPQNLPLYFKLKHTLK